MSMCLAMLGLLAVMVLSYIKGYQEGGKKRCVKIGDSIVQSKNDAEINTVATIVTGEAENTVLPKNINLWPLPIDRDGGKFFNSRGVGSSELLDEISGDVEVKVEEPKKKPKPRVRKPRKNKKTQGKS